MSSENKWLIALKLLFGLLALCSFFTTLQTVVTLFAQFTTYRLMQCIVYSCVTAMWASLAIFLKVRR